MDCLVVNSGHWRIVAINGGPCNDMASGCGDPATGVVLLEKVLAEKWGFCGDFAPGSTARDRSQWIFFS
jgi:hypothetical protein